MSTLTATRRCNDQTAEAHAHNLTTWNRWIARSNGAAFFETQQLLAGNEAFMARNEWMRQGAQLVVDAGLDALVALFGSDWAQVVLDCAKRQAGVE